MAALNPVNERKLKLNHKKGVEDDCMVVAVLMTNESVLGFESDCMVVAVLNPTNESRLKLKQEEFEQVRVLERGEDAQTPLAAVSLGSNEIGLVSDEKSKSANLNGKFSEVYGFIFKSWCDRAK